MEGKPEKTLDDHMGGISSVKRTMTVKQKKGNKKTKKESGSLDLLTMMKK